MNEDSGESLRTRSLNSLGKPIVVYREVRVSAIQIKGQARNRGRSDRIVRRPSECANGLTASLARTVSGIREDEKRLGDESHPGSGLPQALKLRCRFCRPARGARAKRDATPEQEREQKQIIRFLNLLVTDDSSAASAQSN